MFNNQLQVIGNKMTIRNSTEDFPEIELRVVVNESVPPKDFPNLVGKKFRIVWED